MIISFVNQKGGVGKTTLSLATAFELHKERKVLIVDADPQGSVIGWSDVRDKELPKGLSIASLAKKTLHRDLEGLAEGFDHVVIDTPPRLTDITRSAIMASHLIVVPCTPSPYDVWATKETLDLIREATIYHKALRFAFAINRKVANTVLGREVKSAITELGDDFVLLKTELIHRMVFAEAGVNGNAVQEIDKEGKATQEIKSLVEELLALGTC